jgi:hypothetical protein
MGRQRFAIYVPLKSSSPQSAQDLGGFYVLPQQISGSPIL